MNVGPGGNVVLEASLRERKMENGDKSDQASSLGF